MALDDVTIQRLDGHEASRAVDGLAGVLLGCVHAGASVGFMTSLDLDGARRYWRSVVDGVVTGERVLLAALDGGGQVLGTAQLVPAPMPNQPHRADVAKVLVAPTARRRGIAAALMGALEQQARHIGRTLLTLDTVEGGDAERLYERLGWQRTGTIPDYALFPDGRPCATVVFWKRL